MSKRNALFICLGVYFAALAAAFFVCRFLRGGHPLLIAFLADLVATVVVFCFSVVFNNSSLYDSYWSVAPPFIACYWLMAAGIPQTLHPRALVLLALILFWSVRLTFNWTRHWRGIEHEDWRYMRFRQRYANLYWPVSFTGIHLFPTLIVFLGCLALYPVMRLGGTDSSPLGLLDIAALIVTLAAVIIEAAADRQLHRFVQGSGNQGRIMASGLWSRCRHPNYLGEISFWWGLFLFSLAADLRNWWTVVGAVSMSALFIGVSVPMMDRRLRERKPGYDRHMKEVPSLLPRLFRK